MRNSDAGIPVCWTAKPRKIEGVYQVILQKGLSIGLQAAIIKEMRLLRGGQSKHLEGNTLQSIILIVLMFAMLYFFMIRPENKRKKEADNLRSSLTVGDNVLTIGGITGKIVQITEDTITFETGEDRVRLQVKKWAISTTAKMEAAEAEAKKGKRK